MSGTTSIVVAACCGALAGAGLWLTLVALASAPPTRRRGGRSWRLALLSRHRPARLLAALAATALVGLATEWPVAGALAGLGAWWLPTMLGPDHRYQRQVAGVEAVAAWTEMLRDLISGATGLHQALVATVPIAPAPIRDDVARLAEDVRRGRAPREALDDFAAAVDNPIADLVAAALSTATTRHATDLAVLLGSLAEAAREQAAMLVRADANRARVRTSTRMIIGVTLGTAALLLLFSPDYLDPFDTPAGQLVLAAIGVVWAGALYWMTRMSLPRQGPRVLAPATHSAPRASVEVST